MAAVIEIDGMSDYQMVADVVIREGEKRSPRGQATRELRAVTVVNRNPHDCLPPPWRKPNLAIAAVEALQLIGGVSHPDLMSKIAAPFGNFKDGGIFHGAYGPRVRTQLQHVVDRLKSDRDTRQAILTIWDPLHDLVGRTDDVPRDVPCTLILQFFIVGDTLEVHTHMRSNDVFLGFAYDVAQFTMLGSAIAKEMGLRLGQYTHHAGSFHVYERDLEKFQAMVTWPQQPGLYKPVLLEAPGYGLDSAIHAARMLLTGQMPPIKSSSELWYEAQLAKYV